MNKYTKRHLHRERPDMRLPEKFQDDLTNENAIEYINKLSREIYKSIGKVQRHIDKAEYELMTVAELTKNIEQVTDELQ